MVMEPVKGGTLANVPKEAEDLFKNADSEMSIPSWAIKFAASLDNVYMVLSGMSTLEQVLDNTSYMSNFVSLTKEEQELCLKVAEIINKTIVIPCMGCNYCTTNCPMNICIPQYFSLYNMDLKEVGNKGWTSQQNYFANLIKTHRKPSECIKCGQCEMMCPQHLKIRDYLMILKIISKNKTRYIVSCYF